MPRTTPRRPLRILMVTSVYPLSDIDATPPFVANLAQALVAEGFDVRVLAPHGGDARFFESTNCGVSIVRFPYAFPLSWQKLCYEGGMLVNLLKRPWTKLLLPSFAIAQLVAVIWQVCRWRPDILHSHSLLPQGIIVAAAASVTSIQHVTTSHGNDVFGLRPDGIAGVLKRAVLFLADAVTVNSTATYDVVRDLGCNEKKIVRIPAMPNINTLDCQRAAEIRRTICPNASHVIGFVGRMVSRKGVADLLHALRILRNDFPAMHAILGGEGQELTAFRQLAGELGLADFVHWPGWIAPLDVCNWMAACDVLVVPSREHEAQGLVVVEAMLSGTLVVASKLGGIPDMVKHGETGYLFAVGDVNNLASVLRFALSSNYSNFIKQSARHLGEVKFSSRIVASRHRRLYRRMILKL